MTLMLLAFALLALLSVVFVIGGALHDLRARHVERRLADARRALSVVLFDNEEQAARAFPAVSRVPRARLLRIAQGVHFDFGDATHDRLRRLVAASGAARRIRRLAKRRSTSARVQASRLVQLLPSGDPRRDALLSDRSPIVRASVVESLSPEEIGDRAPKLIALLGDQNRAVHIAAQQALLRGDTRVVEAIAAFLIGGEPRGATLALEVAANRPDPMLLDAFVARANDVEPARRVLVAQALGAIPIPRTEELLISLLEDRDPNVRAAAASSAGRMQLTRAAARLGDLLSDQAFAVRRASAVALDALGPPGLVVLRAHLFDRDRYARDMARQVLDASATRRGMPAIMLPESLRELAEDDVA